MLASIASTSVPDKADHDLNMFSPVGLLHCQVQRYWLAGASNLGRDGYNVRACRRAGRTAPSARVIASTAGTEEQE
jgi:hypothetical protein